MTARELPRAVEGYLVYCSGINITGGGGEGGSGGGSGGGNREDPHTLPHADGNEGKVDQRCFNGKNNTASKVWVKGRNRNRY